MSIFKVEVVKINSINPHPNADRLDIVSIENMGYQVIIAKGKLHAGDLAFYFPIDSVIPEKFLDEFGIRNYYSKKLYAVKLRGIFSEGLLIPVGNNFMGNVGDDYTEYFGVTKYEYPIPQGMSGEVESFNGLNNGNIGIAIFAVRRGSYFLNYSDFVAFCEEFALPRVPVLYIGAYTWEAVSQFNNANSVVSPNCIMEGVVMQPVIEKTHPEIGRVVLKLISDRYLLRKDGTELH
ncbi:RNA ligase family protein [Nostoc sp.]